MVMSEIGRGLGLGVALKPADIAGLRRIGEVGDVGDDPMLDVG
jgi:hypothetical protein